MNAVDLPFRVCTIAAGHRSVRFLRPALPKKEVMMTHIIEAVRTNGRTVMIYAGAFGISIIGGLWIYLRIPHVPLH